MTRLVRATRTGSILLAFYVTQLYSFAVHPGHTENGYH